MCLDQGRSISVTQRWFSIRKSINANHYTNKLKRKAV